MAYTSWNPDPSGEPIFEPSPSVILLELAGVPCADLAAAVGLKHGTGDPNGVVSGCLGQVYHQDDAPGTQWHSQGGTAWV